MHLPRIIERALTSPSICRAIDAACYLWPELGNFLSHATLMASHRPASADALLDLERRVEMLWNLTVADIECERGTDRVVEKATARRIAIMRQIMAEHRE